MSEHPPARGILVAHGAMAEGLVDAVRRIAGTDHEALVALSNEGLAPDALAREIEALLGDAPGVVFTDMQSGSCAMAARLTCRDSQERVIVCGVNLPMLLDFVFHREMPLAELIPRVLDRGRGGIQSIPKPTAHADTALSG